MKAEVKGAARKRAGRVAHWAAMLALLSLQAQAFPQETVQAHDRESAMQELLGRLGDASGPCQPAVDPASETAPRRIVRVQCGGKGLSVKYHKQSVADAASARDLMRIDLIRKQLPDDLFAMIRQPLVEFSFDEKGGGKGYYTVWSALPGEWSLHDWLQEVGRRIQTASSPQERDAELKKVYDLYDRMGRFLGAAHRAGLTNAGETFEQLESQSAVQGLDGFNVAVTPEGDVMVDLDALVTDGTKESPARAIRAQLKTLSSELFALKARSVNDVFATMVTIMASLGYGVPLSYCMALEQRPESEVVPGRCFAALISSQQDDPDDQCMGAAQAFVPD